MSFGRLLTAMVTPMNKELEVDYQAAADLAQYLVRHGSDGIVVASTTGESPTLADEEKLELFRVVKKAVGSKAKVIASVGSNSTQESVGMALRTLETEVDGLIAVVPYYNKPSQEGLYRHFRGIAEVSSLPLMMYNVPGRTSANLLPETVLRLSCVPNITALKEASGSMDQVSELKRILPDEFEIFSGDDSLTLPMLALGCNGVVGVGSHIIGNEMKLMIDAWISGDIETARRWHLKLMPIFKGVFITANPVPIKYLLNQMGIEVGSVRPPLVETTPAEEKVLNEILSGWKLR
ncbi:4-hydroxy-tetrahydrodipicolinate synthase [Desulfitobacterium sp. PCE1]|uniref:4-hydroxy-tetrahydrodipicolinate synthase n=1 Tax=Desulfitobacterium sp. PCE1 TaxID=146907 RepID=UPI000487CA31|nr:4-hydroxy-tetrahydrodipicolinate synthase [Desulfitobacterium sp. PCE1]